MSRRLDKLKWGSIVFAALCFAAYVLRQDYFFKQSDQFYYLSLADSLRMTGQLRDRTVLGTQLPITANSGVVFLMAPLSKLGWDAIAIVMCLLYFGLHLSTFVPLTKTLERFGVKREKAGAITALSFFAFPLTMYQLWPINEGPSFALITWFFYFLFVRKSVVGALVTAFLAPMFRVHIFFFEVGALLFARRDRKTATLAFCAIVVSLGNTALFSRLFPYQRLLSVFDRAGGFDLARIGGDLMQSVAMIFVPSTVFSAFGRFGSSAALVLGFFIVILILATCARNIWLRKAKELSAFTAFLTLAGLVYVAFTPAMMARYLVFLVFWILAVLAVALDKPNARRAAALYLAANVIFLAGYLLKSERDSNFEYLKSVRALGQADPSTSYTSVYVSSALALHPRQVYAYFRRPTGTELPKPTGRYLYLAASGESPENLFSGCRYSRRAIGSLALFSVDCASAR